jgi:CheY-like chemotaxis protein
MLPDIDGWRVMDQLRGDAALASIPVHFVSAVDGADRGLSLGAVGYLTKPASRGELAQVVETLGSRREGTRRLLVVDQPDGATHALVRELESETIEARRAGGAAEALELLANDRFDCVILDLDVPGMDGLDLLTSLQAREGVPSIVVYTGRPLSKPEARRLEEFADAVVLKDGSSTERLLDEIRLFLQRLQQGLGNRRTVPERLHGLDARFAGKKVLLVDDDMRTVYALSAALRAKGLSVIVADTGHAALAALDGRSDVAAVLMDIMMPEMDGYEATRRIRKIPRFEKLPIIALTAKAMKGDRAKCLEVGASDYLEKPVDVARLLAMLNGWLARTP